MTTVSVIVPVFNEADNLRRLLPKLVRLGHEIIVVDGHSTDATASVAQAAAVAQQNHVTFMTQSRRGKGNAMLEGARRARGDVVVMFDADGSACPSEIERFVAMLESGVDFARGSRYIEGGGSSDLTRYRSLGNRVLNMIFRFLFRTAATDLCYGFNAFHRRCLAPMGLTFIEGTEPQWGDGFEIETLLACRAARAGLKVREVASWESSRIFGKSHLHPLRDGARILYTLLRERFIR